MASPRATLEATGDVLGDTIGGMFDIPEQHIVEQAEEAWTFGSESYETGKTDTPADDVWDPFSGF